MEGYQVLYKLGKTRFGGFDEKGERFFFRIFENLDFRTYLETRNCLNLFLHPSLISFTDSGRSDELTWFARPDLEGRAFTQFLTEGPQPASLVTKFLQDGLEVLHRLHQRGLVYGAWNPENLLYRRDRWFFTDFGTRASWDWGTDGPKLFLKEQFAQLATSAPEEFQNHRSQMKAHTDLYRLGAVAYLLLLNRPPAEISDGLAGIVRWVGELESASVPLDGTDIPRNLALVINSLLQKAEEFRRTLSISELLQQLEAPSHSVSAPDQLDSNEASAGLKAFLDVEYDRGDSPEEGQFTIDPLKALEKLKSFRFSDPQTFLLPVIACASRLEARSVSFSSTARALTIKIDGRTLQKDELSDLFYSCLREEKGSVTAPLGMGVVGALGAGAKSIRVKSAGISTTLSKIEDPTLKSCTAYHGLVVEVRPNPISQHCPALLEEAVKFCPFPVMWNKTDLTRRPNFDLKRSFQVEGHIYVLKAAFSRGLPGLFIQLDGLVFRVRSKSVIPSALVIVEGPWRTDISFQGVVDNEKQSSVIFEAEKILIDGAMDYLLQAEFSFIRAEFYESVLRQAPDSEKTDKLHDYIVENAKLQRLDPIDEFAQKGWPEPNPLIHLCSLHVRRKRLSHYIKASQILASPAHLSQSLVWTDVKALADDAYPLKDRAYWSFLVRALLTIYGAQPGPYELLQILENLTVVPPGRRSLWDVTLRRQLSYIVRLKKPTEAPNLKESWEPLIPGEFVETRAWLCDRL